MGSYCHLQVSFPCGDTGLLVGIASKHRVILKDRWDEERRIFATEKVTGDHPVYDDMVEIHALHYLSVIEKMQGHFPGPKGGVCTWGETGNYAREEIFVRQLVPFWTDVLSGGEGLPCEHEHVIVFYEHEERPPGAYEIYRTPEGDPEYPQRGVLVDNLPSGILIYHHENLPFRWNQY